HLFPKAETYGVEINEIAVNKAKEKGHTVYLSRFEDLDLPRNFFDVVISIHVIEHVERPDLFLEKCGEIAGENGVVYIETPNTDCLDFKLFKKRHWGGYHPPRHWYLFDIRAFRFL